jgi:hypothetical protein
MKPTAELVCPSGSRKLCLLCRVVPNNICIPGTSAARKFLKKKKLGELL